MVYTLLLARELRRLFRLKIYGVSLLQLTRFQLANNHTFVTFSLALSGYGFAPAILVVII